MKIIFAFVFTLLSYIQLEAKEECSVKRSAILIDNDKITLKTALVDKCKNEILKVINEKSSTFHLDSYLKTSLDRNTITKEVGEYLSSTIKGLLASNNVDCKNSQCLGFAKESFSKANNSNMIIESIRKDYNITIKPITRANEGRIAFLSTIANKSKVGDRQEYMVLDLKTGRYNTAPLESSTAKLNSKKLIVIDIEKSNYYVTYYSFNHELKVFEGKLGLNSFKTMIIELIKNSDSVEKNKITPLNKDESEKIKNLARTTVGEPIRIIPSISNLISSKDTRVITIGDIPNDVRQGIGTEENIITKSQLEQIISSFLNKENKYIENYILKKKINPSVFLIKLFFMHGIISALNLTELEILDINSSDGLLISEDYWQYNSY